MHNDRAATGRTTRYYLVAHIQTHIPTGSYTSSMSNHRQAKLGCLSASSSALAREKKADAAATATALGTNSEEERERKRRSLVASQDKD